MGCRASGLRAAEFRRERGDIVVLLDDGVAFASRFFELSALQNFYRAAVVLDDLAFLQDAGGETDAGPVGAKHGGQKIVGNRENLGFNAVLGHQQPASEALLDAMETIARGSLRDLQSEDNCVALQHALELRSGRKHFAQDADRNPESIAGNLHNFQKRTADQSGHRGNTYESFASYQPGFDGFSAAEDNHQGNQAFVQEVRELLSLM